MKKLSKFVILCLIGSCICSLGMNKQVKAPEENTVVNEAVAELKNLAISYAKEKTDEVTEAATEQASEKIGQIKEDIEKKLSLDTEKNENAFEEVILVSVVDGDTLVVIGEDGLEYKVRLIGIDTPESVHSDASKNNEYGKMASEHTKKLLSNTDVLYLEYDIHMTDKYNRTLAYVWTKKEPSGLEDMLNYQILSDGYAIDKVFKPNCKYAENFNKICKKANDGQKGLWQYDGYREIVER